jgi:hypothetical protein
MGICCSLALYLSYAGSREAQIRLLAFTQAGHTFTGHTFIEAKEARAREMLIGVLYQWWEVGPGLSLVQVKRRNGRCFNLNLDVVLDDI